MTIIKSVYAKGFKSFAKPTEVIFPPGFSIILGPNGSGKSVSYDSIVTLSNGTEIQIGKLVEEKLEKCNSKKNLKDGVYCNGDGTSILSINPITMKLENKEISKFIKREGEELYCLRTRSGREIKATGCHPVMVYKDGMLKSVLIKDLKESDCVAVPRIIKTISENKFDKEKARLIGYLIGDGYVAKDRIEFINMDKEIINDFRDIITSLYPNVNLKERDEKNITRFYTRNKEIVKEIRELFYKNYKDPITSGIKKIPSVLLGTDDNTIKEILAALFDTDGSVRNMGIIEFCSKNKKLTSQIQRLLLRFGILSKVKKRLSSAKNTEKKIRRDYYYLYIYGNDNLKRFYNTIPIRCKHKLDNLKYSLSCNKKSNPNVDLLPQEANFYIKKLVRLLGIKLKPIRKKYPQLMAYCENRCLPSRNGVEKVLWLFENKLELIIKQFNGLQSKQNQLIDCLESLDISRRSASFTLGLNRDTINNSWVHNGYNAKPQNLENFYNFIKNTFEMRVEGVIQLMRQLMRLTESDILWDEIVEIKKTAKEKYVYDLTIPDNHNFIGNGIFVHNSNIIDLITFVLGKSSAKEMRVERSANLIYNGGKDNEPASQAEASMIFDNSKKEFPVNTEEVKITRIVKKDGSSNYYLNDQKMNKQQILDVLSAAKIDPDGHNIVLQGDIIRFTQMKGEERRLIIEEISGISVYEDKKQKAMNELEKVQAKLTEIEIVLAERDAYLRELRKEKTQAKRFRELQEEIKSCKATVLHTYLKEKHEKRDEIEKRINEQKEKIAQIENKLTETKNSINEKELNLESTNKGIEEKGEKEQVELQKSIEATKSEVYKSTSRLEACELEIDRIKKRKEQLKENILDIEKRINEYNKEINNTEKIVNELKEKELSLNKSIEKMNDGPDSNISQISSEIKEIESEIDSSDKNLAKHLNLKQTLIMESNRSELSLQDITKKIIELQASSKEYETNLKAVDLLKKDLKEKGIVIDTAIKERGKITYELESLRRAISKSMEKLGSVRAKQITIKNVLSNDKAVEKILSLNDKKVYGTISQLGIVPDEYALALEVCAGQRLKSIIVDNDLTASRCIDVLKTSKAGVATFLPLNKIKPREAQLNKFKSIQGVIGSAIDVITFDKKFKDVFQYIFGSTLLVKDVNTSRKVGIGRVRMVTLEGDLIETSGAMIGGFRSKSIGFQFSEQQLTLDMNTLEEEISFNKKRIDELETQRMNIENKVINLNNEKSVIEGEIIKLEKQDKPLNYEKFLNEKSRLLSELETKKEELNNLNNSINEYVKSLDTLKKKRSDLTIKLSSSGNLKIKDSLIKLQEEKSIVRERVAGLISQTVSLKVQINSIYKPELDKTSLIIKQSDKELEQFILEINVLKNSLKNRKDELKDKEKREKYFFAQYRELFTKRNKLTENIKRLNELYVNEEKKIKELGNKLNDLSIDRAKVVAEAEGIEKEFEEFNDTVIKRGITFDELKSNIKDFEKELQSLGNVNMRALEIFETVEEEYNKILVKVNVLKQEKDKVLELMSEIEGNKKEMFLKAFNVINKYFSEIFSSLSNKGEAYLEIENKEDIFNSGVDVRVRLLGSKFLDLNSLSGGEKTLTALSFIFAIQECDPASFYILDEVDAALDKTNSTLLSQLLAKYSKRAQYIVISHNDTVITESDAVYGVSMQNGISRVFSLKI